MQKYFLFIQIDLQQKKQKQADLIVAVRKNQTAHLLQPFYFDNVLFNKMGEADLSLHLDLYYDLFYCSDGELAN